jgi:hypothetical protein
MKSILTHENVLVVLDLRNLMDLHTVSLNHQNEFQTPVNIADWEYVSGLQGLGNTPIESDMF